MTRFVIVGSFRYVWLHFMIGKIQLILIATLVFIAPQLSIAEERGEFLVGFALPLTGAAADYGVAIKNSFELARSDRPELFEHIRLTFEDTGYDPKSALTSFGKLVEVDKVNVVVTWGVSFCKALAPVAQARRVPLVALCLDPTVGVDAPYVLRFLNTTDELMALQAKQLDRAGVRKIGLLLAEHPYLEEMANALKRNLVSGQSVSILDELPNTEMNLRSYALKANTRRDVDAIGIFLFAGQISTFYRQATQAGFKRVTFGTNFFESLSEIRSSGGTMEGVEFAGIEIHQDFVDRYRSRFGNESQLGFGGPAYELAISIGELFNESPDARGEKVIESFASILNHPGTAAGPYSYVNDPHVGRYVRFPVVMKKIAGEVFKNISN